MRCNDLQTVFLHKDPIRPGLENLRRPLALLLLPDTVMPFYKRDLVGCVPFRICFPAPFSVDSDAGPALRRQFSQPG